MDQETGSRSTQGKETFEMTRRRKRHNPEQIVRKLRDTEAMLNAGKDLAAVLQALEVSQSTFDRWRNQYGGMKAEEAKRLKELDWLSVVRGRIVSIQTFGDDHMISAGVQSRAVRQLCTRIVVSWGVVAAVFLTDDCWGVIGSFLMEGVLLH
jgi:putative transposase